MENLRFPSNVDDGNRPFMLFSTHTARYNNFGNKITAVNDGRSVALYLPAGYSISDSLNYQSESTGLIGTAVQATVDKNDVTAEDVKDIAKGLMTNKSSAQGAAAAAGGLLGFLGGGGVGGFLGGGLAAGVIGNAAAQFAPKTQVAVNPREFMLFKSPEIRNFSFSFTFIPSNDDEVKNVPKIIKFFRRAAYPTTQEINATYNYPSAFNINVGNSDQIIKIPEVFCTGVTVTYNPNAMSYFNVNNMPVEIAMQLQFRELKPISSEFIDEGY